MVSTSNNMKYKCEHCDEDHDINDLTINIGDEGHQVVDDICKAAMLNVQSRGITEDKIIYINNLLENNGHQMLNDHGSTK